MRVKICGITSVEDACQAAQAGADAIGLNFYAGPRQIDLATGEAILASLPPFVTPVALVGLSGGQIADDLLRFLIRGRVNLLQVHGDFTVGAMNGLWETGFAIIQPLAVRDSTFADATPFWGEGSSRPTAVILDTYDPNRAGGTGQTFCWDWVDQARRAGHLNGWPPIILAGGLNPDNVADAIRIARPWAVDVSSGVELAGVPGRKDPGKVRAFVRAARTAFERNAQCDD
ncbi:MAG: phosphoribosylanthranilate isomerase [Phycisphaerae bacterium]